MQYNEQNLIWIDLEMTGLNPETDSIIEIATIITDKDLNEILVGPVMSIYQSNEILNKMDEWNKKQHAKSGLISRVQRSSCDYNSAQIQTIEFIKEYVPRGRSPMCGNSICQDRRFLARLMPELESFFHYRNLDVSTIKELVNRWYPKIGTGFQKEAKHIALDDIRDSIEELKYYRSVLFYPTV